MIKSSEQSFICLWYRFELCHGLIRFSRPKFWMQQRRRKIKKLRKRENKTKLSREKCEQCETTIFVSRTKKMILKREDYEDRTAISPGEAVILPGPKLYNFPCIISTAANLKFVAYVQYLKMLAKIFFLFYWNHCKAIFEIC